MIRTFIAWLGMVFTTIALLTLVVLVALVLGLADLVFVLRSVLISHFGTRKAKEAWARRLEARAEHERESEAWSSADAMYSRRDPDRYW